MENTFTRFKRADTDITSVLLLDILLNGYRLEEIEKIEEVAEHRPFAGFNRKIRRVYGVTKEAMDVRAICKERASIVTPTICSLQSYEISTVSDVVYCHKAKDDKTPLKIHDLGIISPHMVITSDTVISSKKARVIDDCEYGFTSFMDYVLYGKFDIANWKVVYDDIDKEFNIYYTSTNSNNTLLVYQSEEYGKDATFSLVLYLIKKVYAELVRKDEKFTPDQFIVERWVREKGR